MFSWAQDEEEGAMIGKGKLAIFDDIYENFEKYTLSFEGENYKIPYPYNKNIVDQTDKSNTSYIYVDYDLDQMLKVREIFRKQYYNIKDVDALNTLIENDVDAWKDMVKSDVPQHNINSPMTVKAINQNKLNIIDFDYSAVISQFDERWGNKNWDFTGTLDNSKMNRQSFALASIQGNALDLESFYQLNDDVLYQIDYKKHYNQRNVKVLYYKEELRCWCYGYYLAKMNFSYREAISLGMQFFNSLDVYSFDKYSRTKDLPWRIDALLDGYSGFYSDRNLDIIDVPFIDMYKVYERTAGQDEFDIDWDLNEFTLDAALVFCTSGMYSIGKTSIQVGSKFTMGAAIDITLQIALAKLGGFSTEEAYQQIVWSDVIYSGVETLHSKWATQSVMACMRTAYNEMGLVYDYEMVSLRCGEIFLSNFLAKKLIGDNDRFSSLIRRSLGKDANETINGLWVLGLDKATVEWIVSRVLGDIPKGIGVVINNAYKNGRKK